MDGRRVKKISSAETTIFVYDAGGQLVAEYSTQISQTPQVSYLTSDHLGSPRVVTNGSGSVVSRKDFTAFGEETVTPQRISALGYNPQNIRQDYTGYQKDDESGLEFAQARYYNAGHGRFTSADPLTASASIRDPQTFNRYSYALNSPYKFTDPLGLISSSTGACAQCGKEEFGGGGGAFNGIAGIFDVYYLVTQTAEYQTTAQDGNRQAQITTTVTESLVINRNGAITVPDSNPSVVTTAESVGSHPIEGTELRSIENIVTTAVKLAIQNNFSVLVLLTILKTETEFGILPNQEPGKPAHKISTVNPGQFSKQPDGERAISAIEAGGAQRALEINIGKTIAIWNGSFVQQGKNLYEKFQRYNSEGQARQIAYANKATESYNSINVKIRRRTIGSFFSPGTPTSHSLSIRPCGVLSGCPEF